MAAVATFCTHAGQIVACCDAILCSRVSDLASCMLCSVALRALQWPGSLHALNPALHHRWPGEVDLHRGVAGRLLPVLVRRRLVAARLARSPAWAALAGAWAAQARQL